MKNCNSIPIHDKRANTYDSQVKEYDSHMHEILFDILPTIKEASRILKMNGIFAFTIASLTAKDTGLDCDSLPEYIETPTKFGISICKHSDKYVKKIVETHGLVIHKEQKILADSGDKDIGDILFKVFVVQKTVSG